MNILDKALSCSVPEAKSILQAFHPLLLLHPEKASSVGYRIPIPIINDTTICNLCTAFIKTVQPQGVYVKADAPAFIIGDIHGNLHDLLRCLSSIQSFDGKRIIFLGDYVDRGNYSIEVVCLIYALKICFPDNIYLIRGNHEFTRINEIYGFKEEVESRYPKAPSLFATISNTFNFLPISLLLSGQLLCVHGGISPKLTSIAELETIEYPLESETDLVTDLIWSDPTHNTQYFLESYRGSGVRYGGSAVKQFCEQNGITGIIRGHECVQSGYKFFAKKRVVTVFSSSCYNECSNDAAYLSISEDLIVQPHILMAEHFVGRSSAFFSNIKIRIRNSEVSSASTLVPAKPLNKGFMKLTDAKSQVAILPKLKNLNKT